MMAGFGRRYRSVLLATVPSCWAGLSAGDPGDACATLNEPTIGVNGYQRRLVTWEPPSIPVSGAPALLRCWDTTVWTSTGPWAAALTRPLSHVVFFTASTGTDESIYIGSMSLRVARLIDRAGIVIRFVPSNALTFSIGLKEN